jgi:hypothetical protein
VTTLVIPNMLQKQGSEGGENDDDFVLGYDAVSSEK